MNPAAIGQGSLQFTCLPPLSATLPPPAMGLFPAFTFSVAADAGAQSTKAPMRRGPQPPIVRLRPPSESHSGVSVECDSSSHSTRTSPTPHPLRQHLTPEIERSLQRSRQSVASTPAHPDLTRSGKTAECPGEILLRAAHGTRRAPAPQSAWSAPSSLRSALRATLPGLRARPAALRQILSSPLTSGSTASFV